MTFPGPVQPRRYLFICGLHRSGTSLITRSLAGHPGTSGFRDTGAIEDEGQFLQTVLPLEITYGGVGRFGFDPRAHHTEASPLNTQENARKLISEWNRYWDAARAVHIEKTPSNLLRMRLMAQLLQPSYFAIVTRHPVAACLASMKWTEANLFSLLSHWVHCYRIARHDSARLPNVIWISYEGLMTDPRQELGRLLQFVGLEPSEAMTPAVKCENGKYFTQWREMYFGDGDRAIAQVPPEHYRSLATRLRERLAREKHERSLPVFRRKANLRNFHDALDAAALLESAIQEFGYSFHDLNKAPVREPSPSSHHHLTG